MKKEKQKNITKTNMAERKSKKAIVPIILIIGIFILGFGLLKMNVSKKNNIADHMESESSVEMAKSGAKIELEEIAIDVLPDSLPIGAKVKVDKVVERPVLDGDKEYASDVYDIKADQKVSGPIVIELNFDSQKLPSGAELENLYAVYWGASGCRLMDLLIFRGTNW